MARSSIHPDVQITDASAAQLSPSMRVAAIRARDAITALLAASADGTLDLGSFLIDEVIDGTQRLLVSLTPEDAAHRSARALQRGSVTDAVAIALTSVRISDLGDDERRRLAESVAPVHAALAASGDVAVTRRLLDSTPAGSQLAALVFDNDPAHLGPDAQVSYCQAAQRLESATHARLSAGLVAFAGSNPRNTAYFVDGDDYQLVDVRASELASALAWSGQRARSAVTSARTMLGDLDAAAEAAASGTLQPAAMSAITEGAQQLTAAIDDAIEQARQALGSAPDADPDIADHLWELTTARDELITHYDQAVSAFAPTHTLSETRRKVRDTLAKLDPEGFAARRAKARATQSGVELRGLPDAMAMLTAIMPAEHATSCFRSIDAAARSAQSSEPLGVRRSDALLALCVGAAVPHIDGAASMCVGRVDSRLAGAADIEVCGASGHASDAIRASGGASGNAVTGAGGVTLRRHPSDGVATSLVGASAALLPVVGDLAALASDTFAARCTEDGPASADADGVCHTLGADASRDAAHPERSGLGRPAMTQVRSGAVAHVDLVMTMDTFLGLADTPADCVGLGPIPASAAREFLADAALVRIRRVLVDARTGHALDVGTRRYQLTPTERDYILARDRVCRRPGCNQPAYRCEVDHATAFDDGGASKSSNLGALCVRHHLEKTHGGWSIEASADDGSCTFVSPLGRRYDHVSEPVLPWAVIEPPRAMPPPDDAKDENPTHTSR